MVQFNSPTSILFFAALLASANLSVVCAKPRFTVRDLVDDHLYSRDVDHYDSFITRDEIEELFGRHLDMDLSSIHSRDLADIYARHPDHFVNFFESVGSFVKRCVRGYWRHMVRKAKAIVGQSDGKDELEFLPRFDVEELDPVGIRSTSWFGQALLEYRDAMLPKNVARDVLPREDYDDSTSIWNRDPFDDLEYEEREWDWDLDELD